MPFHRLSNQLTTFWNSCAALLYALSFLIGQQLIMCFSFAWLFPLSILLFKLSFKRLIGVALFFIAGLLHAMSQVQFPVMEGREISGEAYLSIDSISPSKSHFAKGIAYTGKIYSFQSDEGLLVAKNIPYHLFFPTESYRPVGNCNYCVKAILKKGQNKQEYTLKVKKEEKWHPISWSFSLAELRYKVKTGFRKYLKEYYKNSHTRDFLIALSIGENDNKIVSFELSRFGLQHLLAISGFHFSILAAILGFGLRLLFPLKTTALLLMLLLTLYFLFLGLSPSILRAWITVMIIYLGFFMERRPSSLNSLGIALMIILILDPLMGQKIGFQFSFISTAAILLLYSPFERLLKKAFPARRLTEIVEMDRLNQHGFLILTFFRQATALNFAITLAALPLTLFYFTKFPLLGLVYNLFFPFLVGISLFLLLLGSLTCFFTPLSYLIHSSNHAFTTFALNLTHSFSSSGDIFFYFDELTFPVLVLYYTVLFSLGSILQILQKES